jgi:predicted transposase YdaD
MTDLATMFFNDGVEDKAVAITKKLFKTGLSIKAIAEATGLDESTVLELQAELKEAV